MSKFKIGDKAVFFCDGSRLKIRTEKGLLGKTFTLIKNNGNFWCVLETNVQFKEDWLELEEIYNSPLYKALSEDL